MTSRVNLLDFNVLAANFGQSPRTFSQGDFNYDTVVNLSDFNLLAGRFGQVLLNVSPVGSVFSGKAVEIAEPLLQELR